MFHIVHNIITTIDRSFPEVHLWLNCTRKIARLSVLCEPAYWTESVYWDTHRHIYKDLLFGSSASIFCSGSTVDPQLKCDVHRRSSSRFRTISSERTKRRVCVCVCV